MLQQFLDSVRPTPRSPKYSTQIYLKTFCEIQRAQKQTNEKRADQKKTTSAFSKIANVLLEYAF